MCSVVTFDLSMYAALSSLSQETEASRGKEDWPRSIFLAQQALLP